MAIDEEYRTLMIDARDAILKLLDESEPDAWTYCRAAYGNLRDALDRDDRTRERQAEHTDDVLVRAAKGAQEMTKHQDWLAGRRAADAIWNGLTRERRETLVIHVLGDDRLSVREITTAINRELGAAEGFPVIYASRVANLARRLWREGQLEREPDVSSVNRTRYLYRRNRGLEGPIAGLERAYHDESE